MNNEAQERKRVRYNEQVTKAKAAWASRSMAIQHAAFAAQAAAAAEAAASYTSVHVPAYVVDGATGTYNPLAMKFCTSCGTQGAPGFCTKCGAVISA